MELKHYLFLGLTFCFIPAAVWAGIRYQWAEKLLVAGTFFSTCYLVDINILSMELYRGDTRGFEFGVTDWMVISLILVMTLSPRWRNKRPSILPPNSTLMIVYLMIALATLFVSYVPLYGAFGVSKIVRAMAVYWVAYNYLRSEKDLRFFLMILASIVAFEFMLVIQQRLSVMYRAQGSLPHSNTLAMYINMINMVFLSFIINDRAEGRQKLVYWSALGMGTLIVLATFSRGALVVMVVCYAMVIFLSAYDRARPAKLKIIGLLFLLTLPVALKVTPSIIKRFETAPVNAELSRHQANNAAVAMAGSGWLGVGINNYSYAVNNTSFSRYVPLEVDRGIVHNIYLLHAAEMGWIGLFVFLLMIIRFQWMAASIILRRHDSMVSHIAIGIFAAMAALWIQSMLEWAFRQTYLTVEFFMLAGFLAALPRIQRQALYLKKKRRPNTQRGGQRQRIQHRPMRPGNRLPQHARG